MNHPVRPSVVLLSLQSGIQVLSHTWGFVWHWGMMGSFPYLHLLLILCLDAFQGQAHSGSKF